MSAEPELITETSVPGMLRRDLDLGLRMAEALARRGDVGSAIRLVEELRHETAQFLATPAESVISVTPIPRRRARRGATVAAGLAAALSLSLSAAALVGNSGTDAEEPPHPAGTRVEEPASVPGLGPGTRLAPLAPGGMIETTSDDPAATRQDGAAIEGDEPGAGDDTGKKRRLPNPDVPDPLDDLTEGHLPPANTILPPLPQP